MSLTLHVDGKRWRAHLRAVAAAHPGIVPVIKGNGYGLGLARLARKATWLGAETVAVGTYEEIPEVAPRFSGDLLVLSPWRPWVLPGPDESRLIHTVGRPADLECLARRGGRPRVVLEGLTSMRRHGLAPDQLVSALRADRVRVVGAALHLPMTGGHLPEVQEWLTLLRSGGPPAGRVYVSHLTDGELAGVKARHRDLELLPRIGTSLWLGDRAALHVDATVLDSHRVRRGERIGYRQRRVPGPGTVLVVSGGTAHGIGLAAPSSNVSRRHRANSLARGGLEAAGFALSPYTVQGRHRWFVEPPHMQSSMIFLPARAEAPAVGSRVDVDVRFTTTRFDRIEIS